MKKQLILGLLALTSVGTVKPVSGTFSINDTLLETYVISWIALPIIGTVLGIYKGSKNTLVNNTANSNEVGIELAESAYNQLINNIANSNSDKGIYL